jgi:cysteine desulfurase
MMYFDHSATTPVHPDVLALMNSIQSTIYGNPSSIHSLGRKARSIIENSRKQIAKAINAKPSQIVFTSGGTEANNQVFWSMIHQEKKHVLASSIEHPAVLQVLSKLSSFGIEHDLIPVNSTGEMSISRLDSKLLNNTGLVSVMLANNEVGTIQAIKNMVEMLRDKNIKVHTDAVQCLGKMPVDVKNLNVDFLSLSAHKFYGPKGIGVLYFKNKETMSPFMVGGGQESGLRAGTENIASIAGMGLASEIATTQFENHISHLRDLESQFKSGLSSFFQHAIFNGNQNNKLPGLLNISFPGFRSDILLAKLDRAGIAVSSGSACGAGDIKPSPVLSAMGLEDTINISTLRFSFGPTNTSREIDFLLSELQTNLSN